MINVDAGGLMSAAGASGPEWILKTTSAELVESDQVKLRDCACKVWPRLRSFAQRWITLETSAEEKDRFITEAFEEVLVSAARALGKPKEPILDLEAYLATSFRHEIVRRAKREKQLREFVQYMPADELDLLRETQSQRGWLAIEEQLRLDEIVVQMDEWTRDVWIALTYGKSWKEIAKAIGMDKEQAKQRFRYQIKKIRVRLQKSRRKIGPEI